VNSGATSDRVYDALKHRILTRSCRPGDRLEPAALAEALGSSATPVRDALHLLTGERLIETRPGGGFYVPQIDEPALEDLYAWVAQLLLIALSKPPKGAMRSAPDEPGGSTDAARATADLFERIADQSGNLEHACAIRSTSDRLHAARLVEAGLFDDWRDELAQVETAFIAGDMRALRRRLAAYHRRRRRVAATIVRALYRPDPNG